MSHRVITRARELAGVLFRRRFRLRRWGIVCPPALGLAALVAACGGEDTVDNARFVGTWEVAVPAAAGCWSAFALRFTVEAEDAAVSNGSGVLNMVSTWWLTTAPGTTEVFSGSFDQGRDDFTFVFGLQGSTSLRMSGGGVSPTRVTGTFVDRDGVAFPAGCAATAVASHL